MAITAPEKRGRLEDAWALSGLADPVTSLRLQLRSLETAARGAISGGSAKHVVGNSHQVQFADYGPGQITPTEIVELYRWLVDQFDQAFSYLNTCASYGMDPFYSEEVIFPSDGTGTIVAPAILLDGTGKFALLCAQYSITPATVIGQAIADPAIFLWLMYHTVAATESHGDYYDLRVGLGGQIL